MALCKQLLWMLLFLPVFLSADNIEGLIVDENQTPVVGAYIIHLQSEHHAHSNEFGRFFLRDVRVGDTLQVNHLGYEKVLFPITTTSGDIVIELTETIFDLGQVVVGQNVKRMNIISTVDVQTTPVNNAQEILRKVPGLIIGQHAGGGKAEQIFLRGFDIDHGTDITITVDGMPVNMVSHAHGQGYADLHFLIPETIEEIDFGKGPYYADRGNFNTAGYVQFNTKDRLKSSQITLESGQFNTQRAVGLFKILDSDRQSMYVASEYFVSDGPFDASQDFVRNNLMAKYTTEFKGRDRLSVLASYFTSTWDASG